MQYDQERDFEQLFDSGELFNLPVDAAYNNTSVAFLAALSKSLLKDKLAREFPDLITFAYFCRKSNLLSFKEMHLDKLISSHRFGWGVCLHIAPANIPMNFAFSFIMGFMSGNKNIVRLPSKSFKQIDIFLEHFNKIIDQDLFKSIKDKNIFIRTERNSEKLIDLVSKVDLLIVWGGDETVKSFRYLEKKPSCSEVYFPDRVSSFLIDCDYLLEQPADKIQKLCSDFYNDTYLVDQNACSSASMIFWYSRKNNFSQAKSFFSQKLLTFLEGKYSLEPISRIEKDIDVMRYCYLVNDSLQLDKFSDKLWYVDDAPQYKLIKPKLGVFISKELDSLEQLTSMFRSNEQTLTYFGFNAEVISKSCTNTTSCVIDRVVPVGKALDIGFLWDGKNMIYTLSKYMDCQ